MNQAPPPPPPPATMPSYPVYAGPPSRTFTEAIADGFRGYATFSGRASRSAFWYWVLFSLLASAVASVVGGQDLVGLVELVLLLPSLAVGARRLHDTGRSGWFQLFLLVPIAGLVVLVVLWAQAGEPHPNRFDVAAAR